MYLCCFLLLLLLTHQAIWQKRKVLIKLVGGLPYTTALVSLSVGK